MKSHYVTVRVEGASSWQEAEMAVIRSFAKRPPDGTTFHIQPEVFKAPPEPDPLRVALVKIMDVVAEQVLKDEGIAGEWRLRWIPKEKS